MFLRLGFESEIADHFGIMDQRHSEVMGNLLYVISSMILYAKTNWFYKIKFLHGLFDFDESGAISMDEFVI